MAAPDGQLLRVLAGRALVAADLQRWRSAGEPVDFALSERRGALCDACLDRACATCWRTRINTAIPTQGCPLGRWD